jgi:hypothetical protein
MKFKRTEILLFGAPLLVLAVAFVATINSRRESKIDRITEELAQLRDEHRVLVRRSVKFQRLKSSEYQSLLRQRKSENENLSRGARGYVLYTKSGLPASQDDTADRGSETHYVDWMSVIEDRLAVLDQEFKKIEGFPSPTEQQLEADIKAKIEELRVEMDRQDIKPANI